MSVDSVIQELRGKNIHVVGLAGTEGATVVDFLVGRGVTGITAHDVHRPDDFVAEFGRTHQWLPADQREPAARRVLNHPIQVCWADRYLDGIERADVIVVPQSWFRYPVNAPLRRLRERGIRFSSMTQLFFEVSPCPIVGVTGTNGKFTVAHLIHQMLVHSGSRAFFSGNDRSHAGPGLRSTLDLQIAAELIGALAHRIQAKMPGIGAL